MYRRKSFLKIIRAQRYTCAVSIITCCILFFAGVTLSVGSETRHHDAHVHGVGQLNIALDGNNLVIELTSPGANIVGFEHAPKNEVQSKEVHKAEELLKQGDKLFVFPKKAECMLHEANVKNDMEQEEHEDHDIQTHAHEDTHSEKEHGEEMVHTEFSATYNFECKQPANLKTIDVMLFSKFAGFEELEVQLLTPNNQTAVELTPKKSKISL